MRCIVPNHRTSLHEMLVLVACVVLLIAPAALAGPPSSIHVQGILRDNLGDPVSGTKDLVVRLYTQSTGGVALASELRTVTVTEGLFDVQLDTVGNADLYRGQNEDWFFGVSVAGEAELMPRMRVASVPFAHASTSVNGDVETTPGTLVIRAEDGSPDDEIQASVVPGTCSVAINVKGTGADKNRVIVGSDTAGSHVVLADSSGSGNGSMDYRIVNESGGKRADVLLTVDDDNDGESDGEMSQSVRPGTCSVAIKTKGTGADKNRVMVGSDSVGSHITLADTSGAGTATREISMRNLPSASVMETKLKWPGHTTLVSSSSTEESASQLIRNGLPVGPGHTTLILHRALADSATQVVSADIDSDGNPEGDASVKVTPGTSSVAINVKGTGADKNRIISTSYPDSTVQTMSLSTAAAGSREINQRNLPSASFVEVKNLPSPGHTTLTKNSAFADSATFVVSTETNGDNDPEGDASVRVLPGTCSVAIKTRGTGADKNRVISTTNPDSALQVLTADLGGDDDPEGEGSIVVTPGTCSVAIKTKGTGADKNRVIGGTTPDSARLEVSAGDDHSLSMRVRPPGVGTAGSSSLSLQCDAGVAGSSSIQLSSDDFSSALNLDDDGLTTYRVSTSDGMQMMDNSGIVVTVIDRLGNAAFSNSVGVGVSSTTYPIEHSSGAHLTAGGTWVNASDVNLKENFADVDGAELLDQLSRLPITSWNYKNEGASARHIGPTAQDFQKTFGVGSDGKSISTIDPSGIALAAIKELEGRNRELSQQNDQLQEKLEALLQRVEQLERADRAK